MILTLGLVVTGLLLLSGAPVFVAIGLGGVILLGWLAGMPMADIAVFFMNGITKSSLLAMPFFIIAGNLMAGGGVTTRLIALSRTFVGHLPVGLGLSVAVASAFFGACSGSGIAATVALGAIFIPAMTEAGYPRAWSAALIASASCLAYMIPPSTTFIILGDIANYSVGTLFMSGIVPGLLLGILLITAMLIQSRFRKFPSERRHSGHERLIALWKALPGILTPLIILGGIYLGIMTPTESAAVAAIWALIVGFIFYRELNLKKLFEVMRSSMRSSASIYLIIGSAIVLGKVLTFQGIPQAITQLFMQFNVGKEMFLLLVIVLFLFLGMFFEAVIYLYVCLPLLLPLFSMFGISVIQMSVLMVCLLTIGQITPPISVVLFAASGVSKEPPERIFKEVWVFLVPWLAAAFIFAYIPSISEFFPVLLKMK